MGKKRQNLEMMSEGRSMKSDEYRKIIIEMVSRENDTSILIKIYTAVKTLVKGV